MLFFWTSSDVSSKIWCDAKITLLNFIQNQEVKHQPDTEIFKILEDAYNLLKPNHIFKDLKYHFII